MVRVGSLLKLSSIALGREGEKETKDVIIEQILLRERVRKSSVCVCKCVYVVPVPVRAHLYKVINSRATEVPILEN